MARRQIAILCERQRQAQGTKARGCVNVEQPLGSELGSSRARIPGAGPGPRDRAARVGVPDKSWSALVLFPNSRGNKAVVNLRLSCVRLERETFSRFNSE